MSETDCVYKQKGSMMLVLQGDSKMVELMLLC